MAGFEAFSVSTECLECLECRGERTLDAKPFQAKGKLFNREIDLKHPPARRNRSCRGRMKDRRCIEPDISSLSNTRCAATKLDDFIDIFDRDPAILVRSRRNEQRCNSGGNIIEVRAQCHHSGQQVERGSDMNHTALDGPWTKARSFSLLLHAYRSVLMPCERPVGLRRLVKQDSPDWPRGCAQD